jgi:3-deoxy-7-phosphoheptulonate synthase
MSNIPVDNTIISDTRISDTRISYIEPLLSPDNIREYYPVNEYQKNVVINTRSEIEQVLDGKSNKLILIMGPCSIHDPSAAIDYALFIKNLIDIYSDNIIIVMRTYFSKPRTTVGWKGLMYDPYLDGTCKINEGIVKARKVLLDILSIGVPCSMEHLDTIGPQFFDDLLSWAAIGARTTESQIHRELASGISTPVGFKNGTGGSVALAINAIESSRCAHSFMGCDSTGKISSITTVGNPYGHIILRGGSNGPNYHSGVVNSVTDLLQEKNLPSNIFIDFSHGNSEKQFKRQLDVCKNVCKQISLGNWSIKGVMVESNLIEGRQDIGAMPLQYGMSITDACIGMDDSVIIINELLNAINNRIINIV